MAHTYTVILLAVAATANSLELSKCDNVAMRAYYRDIGCVPVGDGPCPTSYDCEAAIGQLKKNDGTCRYKNKTIRKGDTFESGEPCSGRCYCQVGDNGVASFSCPVYDCFFDQLERGCYYRYAPDQCCPVGTMCPAKEKDIAVCEFEGATYYEGQSFSPKDAKCVDCICQKGFSGKVAKPWCKVRSENYILHRAETIHDGCVPVFLPTVCYAPEYRCPKLSDEVESSPAKPYSQSEAKCKFGKLEFNVGDKLKSSDENFNCTCITPPQVTCTSK